MAKLNATNVLAAAATAAALTIAASGSALAHGGGMGGGHMGGNMGGNMGGGNVGHTRTTNMIETNKVTHIRFHDRRRFHFVRFGYGYVDASPVCFYKWTSVGRVRICPDFGY